MAKRQTVGKKRKSTQPQIKSSNRSTYLIIGGSVLVVILLGALLFSYFREDVGILGVINFGRQTREHVQGELVIDDLPPTGGGHSPVWQNCGIYEEPIDVGNAVHSLEHGAAWIAYQPDLPEDEAAYLQDLVRGQTHILLAPYPDLRNPVVVTAWSVQIELESATDDRLVDFVSRYRQGPTTPEQGATCSGGVGEPLS